jgi:homocysteine S-methyltransferase
LADGSEYSGDYGLTVEQLTDWHRERWHLLAQSGADLLACETIPTLLEAQAFLRLMDETPETAVWLSFSCKDDQAIWDGTAVETCIQTVAHHPNLIAVGVNCTAPRFVPNLIKTMHELTEKPLIAYPNSGERYAPDSKEWFGESIPASFGTYSKEWRRMGTAVIGGCCRTTPEHIRQIRDRFPVRKEQT